MRRAAIASTSLSLCRTFDEKAADVSGGTRQEDVGQPQVRNYTDASVRVLGRAKQSRRMQRLIIKLCMTCTLNDLIMLRPVCLCRTTSLSSSFVRPCRYPYSEC